MPTKSIAVIAAALLLVASVAPAVAAAGDLSVAVDGNDDGSATATVTDNGTAVENASVVVNATDGNATYAGEGNYTTDDNGTVDLPAPGENVTIRVLAEYGNETASTTAELVVTAENETTANESFGQRVSAFVHSLLNGTDEQRRIGRLIAGWVTANNPGNAPDHAGPPDDAGPPAFVDDGTAENETDGNVSTAGTPDAPGKSGERGNGNGPPEDRGSNGNGVAKGHGK